jgi:hypothetical protein
MTEPVPNVSHFLGRVETPKHATTEITRLLEIEGTASEKRPQLAYTRKDQQASFAAGLLLSGSFESV